MATDRGINGFLERESGRGFTKLECGLLGALFASIGLAFIVGVGWFLFA